MADRIGYKDHTAVSRLISHYEFLEKVKEMLPPNFVPRGTKLPEGIIREVRRAPEEVQPKILGAIVRTVERYERGEEPGLPSVKDIAAIVDSCVKTRMRLTVEPKPAPSNY
ncbi:MAG: hypothetical protein QXT44_07315 [Candidatus Bathyarchaeia archaeon]